MKKALFCFVPTIPAILGAMLAFILAQAFPSLVSVPEAQAQVQAAPPAYVMAWPDGCAQLLTYKSQKAPGEVLGALETAIGSLPAEDQEAFRKSFWAATFPDCADLPMEDAQVAQPIVEFVQSKGRTVTVDQTPTDLVFRVPKKSPAPPGGKP